MDDLRAHWGSPSCFNFSDASAWPPTAEEDDWATLVEQAVPDAKARVQRAVKIWNSTLRDLIRTETGLRLATDQGSASVPVRVVPGMPPELLNALRDFERFRFLMLHRSQIEAALAGIEAMQRGWSDVQRGFPGVCRDDDRVALDRAECLAATWLALLESRKVDEVLRAFNSDILGAYFYRIPEIRIFWVVIGLYSGILGISLEHLLVITLAHELAHAYTHLGRDIDSRIWITETFAATDVYVLEGLAQFYTQAICSRLEGRLPGICAAFDRLLDHQSEPYHEPKHWVRDGGGSREVLRSAMIHVRLSGPQNRHGFRKMVADAWFRFDKSAPGQDPVLL